MNMSAFNEAWYVLKGWQDEETSLHDELDPSRGKREGKQFEQDVPQHPDYANMAPQELQILLDDIKDQISDLHQQQTDIETELQHHDFQDQTSYGLKEAMKWADPEDEEQHGIDEATASGQTMGAGTTPRNADIIDELISQGKLPKGFKLG